MDLTLDRGRERRNVNCREALMDLITDICVAEHRGDLNIAVRRALKALPLSIDYSDELDLCRKLELIRGRSCLSAERNIAA